MVKLIRSFIAAALAGLVASDLLWQKAEASSNAGDESEAEQFLWPQNQARARLGLAPMVWDPHLVAYATWWASERRATGDCRLAHSGGPYGENIFWGSRGRNWQPADAVWAWLREGQWYNHWSNTCSFGNSCGHYTQIMWRQTTRVGCAEQVCSDGNTFMTCNYYPPGNWVGQRPY